MARLQQNKVAAILRGGASASSTGNSDASGSSDAVAQSEEENPSSAAGPSTCSAGRLPTLERAEIAEQQKKLLSKLKEFRNERLKRLSEELQESTKVAALQCKEKVHMTLLCIVVLQCAVLPPRVRSLCGGGGGGGGGGV